MADQSTSYTNCSLSFEGVPYILWEHLKYIQEYCKTNKIDFTCESIYTITEEG